MLQFSKSKHINSLGARCRACPAYAGSKRNAPARGRRGVSGEGLERALVLFVQPGGMLGRALGLAPFLDHRTGDALELGHLFLGAGIGRQFETVAVRVEEVDGLEDPMIHRSKSQFVFRNGRSHEVC